MPCRYGASVEHRIAVELAEASLEIGFNLVDLAQCDLENSIRIISDAEVVYEDILARVAQLEGYDRENLTLLVSELRRAIDRAHLQG